MISIALPYLRYIRYKPLAFSLRTAFFVPRLKGLTQQFKITTAIAQDFIRSAVQTLLLIETEVRILASLFISTKTVKIGGSDPDQRPHL